MKQFNSFFRLLVYEWKKNFLNPWILVLLLALLLTNGWKLSSEYKNKTSEFIDYKAVYENFYSRWSGPITIDKVEELMAIFGPLDRRKDELSFLVGSGEYTYSEYGDYRFLLSQFVNEIEYDYLYVNQAVDFAQKAIKLAEFYERRGNLYKSAESKAYANSFQNRAISQFADTRYIEVWLDHDYSSMLVLFICLSGLCTVFVTEKESEMYMLQRTSKLGSGMTMVAKLSASALFVILVCVLFYGEDFLVLQLLSGHWEALKSPVYAIRNFEATSLNMTIGKYIIWSGYIKMLGVMGCGCLVLLVSCLCNRVLSSFVASIGGLVGLVILQELCRTRYSLKWTNPLELIMVREIVTDVAFVNILGRPVELSKFVISGVVFVIVAMMFAILQLNPSRIKRRSL